MKYTYNFQNSNLKGLPAIARLVPRGSGVVGKADICSTELFAVSLFIESSYFPSIPTGHKRLMYSRLITPSTRSRHLFDITRLFFVGL